MSETEANETQVVPVRKATVKIDPVGFALYAEEFYIAGLTIPEESKVRGNTTFTPVPFYLMGHSLELIFKAYLLTKGFSIETLKKKVWP